MTAAGPCHAAARAGLVFVTSARAPARRRRADAARPLRVARLVEVDDDDEPLLTGGSRRRASHRLPAGGQPVDARLDAVPASVLRPRIAAETPCGPRRRARRSWSREPDRWATVNLVGARDAGLATSPPGPARPGSACARGRSTWSGSPRGRSTERLMALLGREALLGRLAPLVDTSDVRARGLTGAGCRRPRRRLAGPLFLLSPEPLADARTMSTSSPLSPPSAG